jgi:hypothetical protein
MNFLFDVGKPNMLTQEQHLHLHPLAKKNFNFNFISEFHIYEYNKM